MLDILPSQVRNTLLGYDFVVNYLEGKIKSTEFIRKLEFYKSELIAKGVSQEYIDSLLEMDDGSSFHRKAANSRFIRFSRKLGLDVATKEDKVRFIRTISAKEFLDILSVGAGLLRGLFSFARWKDRSEEKIIVSSLIMGVDLEPPEHSYEEFKRFFNTMRKTITVSTLEMWAVCLYFAIICAHMFPDGNGRLARNAYFMLRSSGLLNEKKSFQQSDAISNACQFLNIQAIGRLMKQEGIRYQYLNDFAADEEYEGKGDAFAERGRTQQLKYIAIRRVLIRNRLWRQEEHLVSLKNLSPNIKDQFNLEYQKVRKEWFWMCMDMAKAHYKHLASELDKTLMR